MEVLKPIAGLVLAVILAFLYAHGIAHRATYGIRNSHPLYKNASRLRWFFVGAGMVLVIFSFFLRKPQTQLATVMAGVFLVLLFALLPDSAFYLSKAIRKRHHD